MGRNMIIRLGVDASDFTKKMQKAGMLSEKTGARIQNAFAAKGLSGISEVISEMEDAKKTILDATEGINLSESLSEQIKHTMKDRDEIAAEQAKISKKLKEAQAMPLSDSELAAEKQRVKIRLLKEELSGLRAAYAAVSDDLAALQSVSDRVGSRLAGFASQAGLRQMETEIDALKQALDSLAEAEAAKQEEEAKAEKEKAGAAAFEEAIRRKEQALKDFQKATSRISRSVDDAMGWSAYYPSEQIGSVSGENIEKAKKQLAVLREYQRALQDFSPIGMETASAQVSGKIMSLEYAIDSYTESLNRTAEAEQAAAGEADTLGDEARKAERPVSKASRSLREMGNSGRRLSVVPGFLRRIRDSANGGNASLEKMVRTIRNVSVVSFGLKITRSLFGELESVTRDYISQNAVLQAQVNGLKASLGQSLAPAIGLVTNVLSYLMPYVVGVSNAFGQLMAALFGSGWSAAASNANKTAAATGGAAKAQKELNRQLLGFDQITKLQSNSDTSAGGGGTGAAIAGIEAKTPAWMERFKSSFTELFNSSEFQAANVGGKIGMILQTGLDWLGTEGMNFDWRGVGTKLRENFDSFIGTGWGESLFHTLGIYLGGFADMVIGFMEPQWEELKIAYQNEGWQGAVVYILGMTAGLVGNGISGLFTKVLSPMFAGIADYFREHGEYSIAGFFDGIAQWMTDVGTWIKENITDPVVNWIKNLLGIHSPSTVFASIGEDCMNGMGNGFSNGVSGVLQKLTDLKEQVLGIASSVKEAFSFEWKLPHLRLPHLSVSWEPVDNILAQFFGVTAFPHLSVQWFAKGGILDGAQIFGRMGSTLLGGGERGREAILPLDTNTGWMDDLAQHIAMTLSTQGGGDVNAVINLMIDSEILTTYTIKGLRKRARAGITILG